MSKIRETNGLHYNELADAWEPIYCTVNGTDCPYYIDGICHILDPIDECDDFAAFWESWEEWESY